MPTDMLLPNPDVKRGQSPALPPDDVAPPSYSEAVRQPNRPDDAVRQAWRRGISHGSLDMDSFHRLLSPVESVDSLPIEANNERPEETHGTETHDEPAEAHDAQDQAGPAPEEANGAHEQYTSHQQDGRGEHNYHSGPRYDYDEEADERTPMINDVRTAPGYGSHHAPDYSDRRGDHRERRGRRGRGGAGRGGGGEWRGRGRHYGGRRDERSASPSSDSESDDGSRRGWRGPPRKADKKKPKNKSGRCWGRSSSPPKYTEEYEKRRKRRIMKLGGLIVGLAIFVMAVQLVAWGLNHKLDGGRTEGDDDEGTPGDGNLPVPPHDGNGRLEPVPEDGHANPPLKTRESRCEGAVWTNYTTYTLDAAKHLKVLEELDQSLNFVTGDIRFVKALPDQTKPVRVSVAYAMLPDFTIGNIGFSIYDEGLKLNDPSIDPDARHSDSDHLCLDVDIIVSVRSDLLLQGLELDTARLSIAVEEGVFANATHAGVHVQDDAIFSTISGKVTAPYVSGRKILVETKSGRIIGSFSLYDSVELHSISGHISAFIDPKPASEEDPCHPAELLVDTKSSHVEISMPLSDAVPARAYYTIIETISGHIQASILSGDATLLKTKSGKIEAEVQPYMFWNTTAEIDLATASTPADPLNLGVLPLIPTTDRRGRTQRLESSSSSVHALYPIPPARLRSETISGHTQVRVLPHLPAAANLSLNAVHQSMSAAIELAFPAEWSGSISATSLTGAIDVRGSRLERSASSKVATKSVWDLLREIADWLAGLSDLLYGEEDTAVEAASSGLGGGAWRRVDERGEVGKNWITAETVSGRIGIGFEE